jgi:hypothetical protein
MQAQRARILNKSQIDYLFDHILGRFETSKKHIENALATKLISKAEADSMQVINADTLIKRIKDFRIVNRLLSVAFAILFSYMQVGGDDVDARRPSRTRTRRRNETEQII